MKKISTIWIVLGCVLMVAGLLTYGYQKNQERVANETIEQLMKDMEQKREEMLQAAASKEEEERVASQGAVAGDENPQTSVAQTDYSQYRILGILHFPSLGRKVPVLGEEMTDDMLNVAPCHYGGPESPQEAGNIIIAGHNYKSHFGSLRKLKPAQIVVWETPDGFEHRYEVSEVKEIEPNDFDYVEKNINTYSITLFTCTDSGRMRWAVKLKKSTK